MERLSMREAAEYLGTSWRHLYYHVKNGNLIPDHTLPAGEKPRRFFTRENLDRFRQAKGRHRPAEEWAEILRRYRAGETAEALGAEYNLAPGAIRNKIAPRRPRLSDADWRTLIERRQRGETTAALASEYGVSMGRIRARAKEAG